MRPWLPSEADPNRVSPRECVAAARRALDKTYPLGQGQAAIPLLIEAVDWLRRALEQMAGVREHAATCASRDRLHDPGPEGEGTFDERGWYHPLCDCAAEEQA